MISAWAPGFDWFANCKLWMWLRKSRKTKAIALLSDSLPADKDAVYKYFGLQINIKVMDIGLVIK